jgi:molybdopterin molybdotransferase
MTDPIFPMKTPQEAFTLMMERIGTIGTTRLPMEEALGLYLAGDAVARISMPPFAQSAMDGYALGNETHRAGLTLEAVGVAAAGGADALSAEPGRAVRIFTGARVPAGSVSVVQQEWVERTDTGIRLLRDVPPGANIRQPGENFAEGEVIGAKGTRISPAVLASLAMAGVDEVEVYRKPKASLLVTGDELTAPGRPLPPGCIYDSNGPMLRACLAEAGIACQSDHIADQPEALREAVTRALAETDALIISGGMSVGDRDYVKESLIECGVEVVFHKVSQKPGKPFLFGMKGDTPVFGLPGNPAAAMTCFHVYVKPALKRMSGSIQTDSFVLRLPYVSGKIPHTDRTQFLKARMDSEGVRILDRQSSADILFFARANALAIVPTGTEGIREGDLIEVLLLV